MSINTVGVVGAGIMGNGIAQAFAVSGVDVVLTDIGQAQVDKGLATISGSLDRLVKKEKMTAEAKAAALAHIKTATSLDAHAGVDLVIEAATENLALKLDLFKQIDKIIKPDTILATNTSSISVTAIAAALKRPGRLVGMHFFNPAPVMVLVEVVSGLATDAGVAATIYETSREIGRAHV